MKFCGIICEFNPLHNGHQYLIKQAKEKTNLPIVCVMSGNFTQRAEKAILNKHIRAKHAIEAGADIVIELPTIFATSNAETFARGAIQILNSLGCVENLFFGSECGNIEILQNVANFFENNAKKLNVLTKQAINTGKSYPAAIEQATKTLCNELNIQDISSVLKTPNNLLAVEYLKQLSKQKSKIKPLTIKRQGEDYKSQNFSCLASASKIREEIFANNAQSIKQSVPPFVFKDINSASNSDFVQKLQLTNIKTKTKKQLKLYFEIDDSLCGRLKKFENSTTYNELIENTKTKRFTHNKIRRAVLNVTLNVTKKVFKLAQKVKPYANILAIKNKNNLKFLNHKNISIIYSARDLKLLSKRQNKVFAIDKTANLLYEI